MPLKSLTYRPGVSKEATNLSNEGGWYGADKVRFRSGFPEKLGGWSRFNINTYENVARTLFNWTSTAGNDYLAVGTNKRIYVEFNGELHNITPFRETQNLAANPLTTVISQAVIYVTTVAAHSMATGDYVVISGATTTNGIPDTEINTEHSVTVTSTTTFYFSTTTTATSSGSGGGSSVVLNIEASAGLPFATTGLGWGIGTWGRGTWGSASTSGGAVEEMGYWSADNYGQDLVIAPRNGGIYYWAVSTSTSAAGTPNARAVYLNTLTGASDVPSVVTAVFVSEDNHIVAMSANAIGQTTPDPLLLRWSSIDNPADWTPKATNDAGGQRLAFGDKLVTAIPTREETLVFTNSALYSMKYTGAPYTFTLTPVSTNVSIAGPFAAVSVNNQAVWFGHDKFFTYAGTVDTLPCSLRQYIFSDFNYQQKEQVTGGINSGYNEIWWFYCPAGATYPTRYVCFNYLERIWYYGQMSRTAFVDAPNREHPVAAQDGYLVYHEDGQDDNLTGDAVAFSAYIQSADFDIEDGFQYSFIKRLIPDLTFTGSSATSPQATMTLYARDFPGGAYDQQTDEPITRSATTPVEQFTNQVWVRLRGRQVSFRISSDQLGVAWQLGTPRIDIQPDGRR